MAYNPDPRLLRAIKSSGPRGAFRSGASAPFPFHGVAARSAVAVPAPHDEVVTGVGMPIGAMGFPGVDGCVPVPAENVLPVGHGFHVRRVDAGSVAAEVIDGQPLRDRTDKGLVGNAVGAKCSPVHLVVAVPFSASSPDPRPAFVVEYDAMPEAVGESPVAHADHGSSIDASVFLREGPNV